MRFGRKKFFLIDDKVYSINDGDVFVMNQFEAHKITFLPPTARWNGIRRRFIRKFIFSASTDMTDLSQCFYMRKDGTSNRIPLYCPVKNRSIYADCLRNFQRNSYGDDIIKIR